MANNKQNKTNNKTNKGTGPRQQGRLTAAGLDRAERDAQAIMLRNEGKTFDEIADILGMAGKGTAYKAVERGMARWAAGDLEELRALELARTDAILARLWPLIDTDPPGLAAIDRYMKVMDYRARICGLNAPKKHQVGVQVEAKIDLRALAAAELLSKRPELVDVIDTTLEAAGQSNKSETEVAGDE